MWSTYLFKVTTGELGPRIFPSASSSWSMVVNEIESANLTLEKSAIPDLPSKLWLEPWWAGVVLMYDGVPILAGPIVSRPIEDARSIRLSVQGVRSLFSKRMILPDLVSWRYLSSPDHMALWNSGAGTTDPAKHPYYRKTYATILRIGIEQSMRKHGGQLPIRFTVPKMSIGPKEDIPDNLLKETYDMMPHFYHAIGTEMQEATLESMFNDIISRENGPDTLFKPNLTPDYTIRWDFIAGKNDEHNEIPNGSDSIWDSTVQGGAISDLTVNYLGTEMTNRAFVRGSGGADAGIVMRVKDQESLRDAGYPLLESYELISKNQAGAVQAKANENLRQHDQANHQINATVRADGPNKLGTFWPGEYGQIITSGWYGLRNGSTRAKILSISGDLSNNVEVSFKETEVL